MPALKDLKTTGARKGQKHREFIMLTLSDETISYPAVDHHIIITSTQAKLLAVETCRDRCITKRKRTRFYALYKVMMNTERTRKPTRLGYLDKLLCQLNCSDIGWKQHRDWHPAFPSLLVCAFVRSLFMHIPMVHFTILLLATQILLDPN